MKEHAGLLPSKACMQYSRNHASFPCVTPVFPTAGRLRAFASAMA